jgi:hypothetical protein
MSPKKPSEAGVQANVENSVPRHGDKLWARYWHSRAWTPPDRTNWQDISSDRRLLLYSSSLRDKFGFVRFVGLPTQGGPEDTPIEALYVEPALSIERIDPNLPLSDWPDTIPLIDAVIDNPRLVILGDPGSGKSTLIGWLVLSLLSRERNRLTDAVGELVPLALTLRDLTIDGHPTWEKLLARFVAHPCGQALGTAAQVEPLLKSGQAMILIDGLDEAGGTDVRKGIIEALHDAFERYPSVRWVVTSRVVGYQEAAVELAPEHSDASGAVPIHSPSSSDSIEHNDGDRNQLAACMFVAPFDDIRIHKFVRNWHEQHETNRSERATRSAELIDAINRSPQVNGLARVPNLLTMIALVYRVYLRLPDGRALLYERIAQAYLETIETARKLPTLGHTLEDMKRWLGYAAFQMQMLRFGHRLTAPNEGGILVSRSQLVQWIEFAMTKGSGFVNEQHRSTAAAFVDWVARRAGLIIPRSEDLFAFAHLSFQEYFAAWFITEQVTGPNWNKPKRKSSPLSEGTELATLRSAARDPRWRESFLLMFELLAVRGEWADEILEQLLSPQEDSIWVLPRSLELKDTSANAPEIFLVLLARDRHSGLSQESRAHCFRRAWIRVEAESALIHATDWLEESEVAAPLLEPQIDGPSPAWATLRTTSLPIPIRALLLHESASDAVALEISRPHSRMDEMISLCLWGPRITDAGIRLLAREGTCVTGLKELLVGGSRVSDSGVEYLARTDTGLGNLIYLNLGQTRVTDVGVRKLACSDTGLKLLETLYLWETGLTDEGLRELCGAATGLKSLKTLSVRQTRVTDAGLQYLSDPDTGLKGLKELFLGVTELTDSGLTSLARENSGLNSLLNLAIDETGVTDDGIQYLARTGTGLKKLTSLNLAGTGITDAALRYLVGTDSGLASLTSLDLSGTKITDAGIDELAHNLKSARSLALLKVSATNVTSRGIADFEAAVKDAGVKLVLEETTWMEMNVTSNK